MPQTDPNSLLYCRTDPSFPREDTVSLDDCNILLFLDPYH